MIKQFVRWWTVCSHSTPRGYQARRAAMQACRAIVAWLFGYHSASSSEFIHAYQTLYRRALSGRRVLDVGCGLGEQSEEVIAWGFAHQYIGMDVSSGLIRAARENHADHVFCVGDGAAIPFCDRAVDVVTTSFTVHHIEPAVRPKVMAEMMRVAASRVIIRDLFGPEPGLRQALYWLYYSLVDGSYYRFTLREWRAFFDECGAEIETEIHSDDNRVTDRFCCFVLTSKSRWDREEGIMTGSGSTGFNPGITGRKAASRASA
jgi:ubiquinone/menaquinone biosynthesis C-methylase UbiE